MAKGRALLRWFGAVRVRAAVVTVVVVGSAFALSALSILSVLRGSLDSSAANTAKAEALGISSFVTSRASIPAHLPVTDEAMAGQIIAANGSVLASTHNIVDQPAMVDVQESNGHSTVVSGVVLRVHRETHVDLFLDSRFVVAAVGFKSGDLSGTVLIAESLGAADHTMSVTELALGVALPLLTLLLGILVYVLTGWSLRPVETIRSEVAALSASDLPARVAEPNVDDEIGRLARTMNEMLARLESSTRRERQLVADVSHELRNPIAALKTELEVAAAHPGPATTDFIEAAIVEVDRLSQLIDDLLTLARLDEGMLPLHLGTVDLDELVLHHAERLRARGRVEVSVHGVGAVRVNGDAAQLGRVVANLADNAERHAGRRVEFSTNFNGDVPQLVVADDGPGVPWFDRDRIFERFVRLDAARTHEGTGAGLGLAIVKEIVSAHHGTVAVEDNHPGARFVVRIARLDSVEVRQISCVRPEVPVDH